MLFPYQYLPHKMDTMQTYIEYIFDEVWLKAIPAQSYDIAKLFAGLPDLRDMITELHTQTRESANDFLTSLQALFEIFKTLDTNQKDMFEDWFILNNDIQHLCEQGDKCQPATYSVIANAFPNNQFPDLVVQLKRFYKNLYSANFLKLQSVQSRIGLISDHNVDFTDLNDRDVCPFCGLSGMKGRFTNKHEAYDHYFPKDKYPFNSINFRNLVPACPHCNSSYKLAQDPHYNCQDPLQAPRKVFYPFTENEYTIDLSIEILNRDWENLIPIDIDIEYGPTNVTQEIETWKDIYGIDERYKAECCSNGAGKAWLVEVLDEWAHLGNEPDTYLTRLQLHCNTDRHVEKRFLKKAFLEGCERAGLFGDND